MLLKYLIVAVIVVLNITSAGKCRDTGNLVFSKVVELANIRGIHQMHLAMKEK